MVFLDFQLWLVLDLIKNINRITKKEFKHTYKPDGISCGPTCLKMISDYYTDNELSIHDLKQVCKTDNIKGTTLEDMIRGMNYINIPYQLPTLKTNEEAIRYLNNSLNSDGKLILRTLIHGIKHWIIVTEIVDTDYIVYDPWLGKSQYNKEQIIDIWKPRDFHCIRITK